MLLTAEAVRLIQAGATPIRIGFAPDTAPAPILVGCFAALIMARRPVAAFVAVRHADILEYLSAATIIWCLIYGFSLPGGLTAPRAVGPVESLMFAALVAFVLLRIAATKSRLALLGCGPLVTLGRISYGLYLWHVILLASGLLPPGIAVLAAAVIAVFSYHFVEQPFLRRRAPRVAPVAREETDPLLTTA